MTHGPALTLAAWGETLEELAGTAARAEAAGFDAVWVPELHRSASVSAAALARTTSRIRVGTAIMWAFVRSPMTIALEALDLDELAGGRFVLGLGSGVRRLNEEWHGAPWARPVQRMREVVAAVRHFVAHAHEGEPMLLPGELASLRVRGYARPRAPTRARIPIHLAAVGPRMTELAGEIADGWIAHALGSPESLREIALPRLTTGLRRAGRGRGDLEVVASACCVPHDDHHQARRWAAHTVAFYAAVRTYEPMFAAAGFAEPARAVQAAFRAGDRDRMVAAVPDAMVDAFTVAGRPVEVRERLRAYGGAADTIKLSPPTEDLGPEVTRAMQDSIIAMVQSG